MPIIKSSIKRMKQNEVRHKKNRHYGSRMKSLIKLVLDFVNKGDMDKAKKTLPEAISAIDMAAKKNIVKKNNAARKKSKVQRAVNVGPSKKEEVVAKAPKAEKGAKKEMKKEVKKATSKSAKTVKKDEKKAKKASTAAEKSSKRA